jgi:hypothetical protein
VHQRCAEFVGYNAAHLLTCVERRNQGRIKNITGPPQYSASPMPIIGFLGSATVQCAGRSGLALAWQVLSL